MVESDDSEVRVDFNGLTHEDMIELKEGLSEKNEGKESDSQVKDRWLS